MLVRVGGSLRHVGLLVLCGLASCQPPPLVAAPDPVPVDGVGYLIFNAPISISSRDLLIADVDKLRTAEATEIDIGLNSGGGDIDAAQGIVDYMTRMHDELGLTFKAYNIGLVASAATYVFPRRGATSCFTRRAPCRLAASSTPRPCAMRRTSSRPTNALCARP